MRVVFLILDGMPSRHAGPLLTPTLAALAAEGGGGVGRSVMTSATYPNHATFATGTDPAGHGVLANWIVRDGAPRPAFDVGPRVPTLFDACRAAGRSSFAVVGDQNLVGVMGARAADAHWPPEGVLPAGTEQDAHGYARDLVVLPLLVDAVEGGAELVVGHFNEPDTAAHDHGPDSEEAAAVYRATDSSLAVVIEALRPAWDDAVVIVVSDHSLETVDLSMPEIDLYGPLADSPAAGAGLIVIPEGGAAVVWGDDPTAGSWLDAVPGVSGHRLVWPGARLVWSGPGRVFALPPGFAAGRMAGNHGGIHTRDQVAVVAGGHPAASAIAATLAERSPAAADWAVTIAALLGVELAQATGQPLL